MKNLWLLLSLTAFAFNIFNAGWKINTDYQIKFDGGKVQGIFKGLKGEIYFDVNDLTNAKILVEVDVNTINTGKSLMNEHAKNESWFDAKKYPKIIFKSLEIKILDKQFSVLGELTMHGIKKAISFPFQFKKTENGGLFEAQFKVNRKDFGINGNAFEFMVGDLYKIDLLIPVNQKSN